MAVFGLLPSRLPQPRYSNFLTPIVLNFYCLIIKVTPRHTELRELVLLTRSARLKQMRFEEIEHRRIMQIMEAEHKMRMCVLRKEIKYWERKLTGDIEL